MIAYRVEIWCQRCNEGYGKGTPTDDHASLPSLGRNLEEIYLRDGWTKIDGKHYCPACSMRATA